MSPEFYLSKRESLIDDSWAMILVNFMTVRSKVADFYCIFPQENVIIRYVTRHC